MSSMPAIWISPLEISAAAFNRAVLYEALRRLPEIPMMFTICIPQLNNIFELCPRKMFPDRQYLASWQVRRAWSGCTHCPGGGRCAGQQGYEFKLQKQDVTTPPKVGFF